MSTKVYVIFMPSRAIGGAEQISATLASALSALEYCVHYAIPFSSANAKLRSRLVAAGVAVENLDFELSDNQRSPVQFTIQTMKAVRWLRNLNPAGAMVFLPWPTVALAVIFALAWSRIPALLIFQLVPPRVLIGRRHQQVLQWVVNRATMGCVAVCDENRRILIEQIGLPTSKVSVVYNGTPEHAALSEGDLEDGLQFIHSRGLNLKRPFVISSGRLCHQKGYDLVVPALPHLREEFPDLRCLWLGAPETGYADTLEASLQRLGVEDLAVRPGAVSNLGAVLTLADIFLFPSRFEGHSLALTEAMAAGVPIVASDASGISEVIRHGVEGLIFRNGDSCDLMEKLRWALRHPKEMKRMGQAARERQKEFTEEKMIAGTLACLTKLERGELFA